MPGVVVRALDVADLRGLRRGRSRRPTGFGKAGLRGGLSLLQVVDEPRLELFKVLGSTRRSTPITTITPVLSARYSTSDDRLEGLARKLSHGGDMSEEGARAALSRKVKSCSVATLAGPDESLDAARPMALVRKMETVRSLARRDCAILSRPIELLASRYRRSCRTDFDSSSYTRRSRGNIPRNRNELSPS